MISKVKDCLNEGLLPEFSDDLDYGQTVKIRENERVVDKQKRTLIGWPEKKRIETFNVENFNSILRNFLSRLARKGKGFSKNGYTSRCSRMLPIPPRTS